MDGTNDRDGGLVVRDRMGDSNHWTLMMRLGICIS